QPSKLAGRDIAALIGHTSCCDLFNTGTIVPWRHIEKPSIHNLPTIPLPNQSIPGHRSFVPLVCERPSNAWQGPVPSIINHTALPKNSCILYDAIFLRSPSNRSMSSSVQ